MTPRAGRAPHGGRRTGSYREPARSYLSSAVLAGLIAAGFLLDEFLGGGLTHALAWAIAFVLVVGVDALTVYAARSLRTVTVTDTELRVGEQTVPRADILGVARGVVDGAHEVLGRSPGAGLPRGVTGVSLQLADGRHVVVPTRRPERLAAALAIELDVPDVRPAEDADLPVVVEIDERADSVFRVAGLEVPRIPLRLDDLREAKAVFVHGRPPVGFVWVGEADGLAHIEQLSVLPGHMRRGLGSALLEAACAWAAEHGYRAVTLTTYAEVPWNGPFYAARGFAETDRLTPDLVERRDWERSAGLDEVGRRVVMRRDL